MKFYGTISAIGLDVDWAYLVNFCKCDWADKHQSKEVFFHCKTYSHGVSVYDNQN